MRLAAVVLAVLGLTLVSSDALAITTYSSSPFSKMIATGTVPDRNDAPLYFSILSGTFAPGTMQEVAGSDGIYYQFSGTGKINKGGTIAILRAGDGIFMPAGTKFTLSAENVGQPSTYLQFLLSPDGPRSNPPNEVNGTAIEVYRSPSSIPGLMLERNFLSLSRTLVPPQSPCDPLHRRSGAALHYILSGAGAEFTENRAMTKGPGSVSYEPGGLFYQWSNPGSKPLVYLLFNVNPKEEPPVVEFTEYTKDPFSGSSHVNWAIGCVALSAILTALVAGGVTGHQQSGKRWKK